VNFQILNEVVLWLRTEDILRLSETSKSICQAVRINRNLHHRLRLSLSARDGKTKLKALQNLPIRWKHVSLEVDGWTVEQLKAIKVLLAGVISLELLSGNEKELWKLDAILPTELEKILLSATGLRSLAFGGEIFSRDLSQFFTPAVMV